MPSPEPQTHILIIGVDTYPYANGGNKYEPGAHPMLDKIGQLSCPVVSAKAFHEKVLQLEDDNLWHKPLGELTLLYSGAPTPDKRPTRESVKNAYREWKRACNQHPDNAAIFFFSGHGVEKQDHYLLLEDFGQDADNIWEGTFDFDSTRQAFHDSKAKTQCFFVDACREVTLDMLTRKINALPLEEPSEMSSECEFNLTIKATAHNEASLGRKGKVSFFAQALIKALDEYAFENVKDEWIVRTNGLSSHMNEFIGMVSGGIRQRCSIAYNQSSLLLKRPAPPKVEATISCDPDPALPHAHLGCVNPDTGYAVDRPPAPSPWKVQLECGIYKISATFNGAPFRNASKHIDLKPFPIPNEILKCQL